MILAALAVHGWLDGYFANNSNHPDPQLNFFSGVGTTAHRADKPALNVAALDVAQDAKPVGFHITVVTGDAADVVHSAEPSRHPVRNIYQASVLYDAKFAQFEAGVYPSHIGFEGFFTKDNWNYTRGWSGELSPYYQAGIKASKSFGPKWSGQVHVLRGWQNISAHLPAALGTQIAYASGPWSASFNTYVDADRKFGDLVGTYKVTPGLSLGASIDRGRQAPANWLGAGVYGRYAFDDRRAIAFRAERFHDPDGGISGIAQTLSEATLTYEVRPSAHLILKFEGRHDRSTAAVFSGSNNQTLALASAVAVF